MKIIISENQYRNLRENVEMVDDIIDKMAVVSYEGLTSQEKDILKKYSEYLNSDKKNDFSYEDPEDIKQDRLKQRVSHQPTTIKGKLKNNDRVEYVINSKPMKFNDFTEHESSIIWDDEEWDGYIGVDDFGNITQMDYGTILNDKNETYVSLKHEMGPLWEDLKLWIQEVVVPKL